MPHGELAPTTQPARTYEPTPLSLTDSEKLALKALADNRFEGNKSMAARYMIRHFALCQFPVIGIDRPGAGPEPNASEAGAQGEPGAASAVGAQAGARAATAGCAPAGASAASGAGA